MENHQSSYYSDSYGDTAVKISHDTVYQKVSEQHILQQFFTFNSFGVISDLLNVEIQSSHYSVSYGDTALKLFSNTEHYLSCPSLFVLICIFWYVLHLHFLYVIFVNCFIHYHHHFCCTD